MSSASRWATSPTHAAPGTRETNQLHPSNLVDRVHAIKLAGGRAWGLDASGVMQWLEEKHIGLQVGFGLVPTVPAAMLFDLPVGDATIRPNASAGYQACVAARRHAPVYRSVLPPAMPASSTWTATCCAGRWPGGYSAAFRTADLGLKAILVERYACPDVALCTPHFSRHVGHRCGMPVVMRRWARVSKSSRTWIWRHYRQRR